MTSGLHNPCTSHGGRRGNFHKWVVEASQPTPHGGCNVFKMHTLNIKKIKQCIKYTPRLWEDSVWKDLEAIEQNRTKNANLGLTAQSSINQSKGHMASPYFWREKSTFNRLRRCLIDRALLEIANLMDLTHSKLELTCIYTSNDVLVDREVGLID
jgi:hypothetical protein